MFKSTDRVKETATTTGTGDFTLAGAVAGFVAFSSVYATNDQMIYAIVHQTISEWEIGVGKLTAGTTLSRVGVIASSNSNAAVSFSTGTKDVMVSPTASDNNAGNSYYFGSGSDGDAAISSGTTTLTKDTYYRNLTISGTGKVVTGGYRLFVSEVLDLSNAPADAVNYNGTNGNGATGSPQAYSGGPAPTGQMANGTVGGCPFGPANGADGTLSANGGLSAAIGACDNFNGGAAGASGAGGNSGVLTGGGSRGGQSPTLSFSIQFFTANLVKMTSATAQTLLFGGVSSSGGGGGAGNNASNAGGGGGSGAYGGGVMFLSARIVKKSASTPAACICAKGGNGGNGWSTGLANTAGGAGGGGAGGGWVFLCVGVVIGPAITGMVSADGGNGGAGGNGTGSGYGGNGGTGGTGGRIMFFNLGNGTVTETIGVGGATGGTGLIGGAGGSAGTGNSTRINL